MCLKRFQASITKGLESLIRSRRTIPVERRLTSRNKTHSRIPHNKEELLLRSPSFFFLSLLLMSLSKWTSSAVGGCCCCCSAGQEQTWSSHTIPEKEREREKKLAFVWLSLGLPFALSTRPSFFLSLSTGRPFKSNQSTRTQINHAKKRKREHRRRNPTTRANIYTHPTELE